jgi:hypothetical protein
MLFDSGGDSLAYDLGAILDGQGEPNEGRVFAARKRGRFVGLLETTPFERVELRSSLATWSGYQSRCRISLGWFS